jgi:ribonuclease P protein component
MEKVTMLPLPNSFFSIFMIKKIYRLNEIQTKKVLSQRKPFFSYGITLNYLNNNLNNNRFSIIISWKSVNNSVNRNFFRRKFYNLVEKNIITDWKNSFDMVFLLKKQTKLDKNDFESIKSFENDITFLLRKILKS